MEAVVTDRAMGGGKGEEGEGREWGGGGGGEGEEGRGRGRGGEGKGREEGGGGGGEREEGLNREVQRALSSALKDVADYNASAWPYIRANKPFKEVLCHPRCLVK